MSSSLLSPAPSRADPVRIAAATALLALATLLPGAVRSVIPAAPDVSAGQAPDVAAVSTPVPAVPGEGGTAVLDATPEMREDG